MVELTSHARLRDSQGINGSKCYTCALPLDRCLNQSNSTCRLRYLQLPPKLSPATASRSLAGLFQGQLAVSLFAEEQPPLVAISTQPLKGVKLKQRFYTTATELALMQRTSMHHASEGRQIAEQGRLLQDVSDRVDELLHRTEPAKESPFFSLPREIRDLIYEAALGEHSYSFGDGSHDIRINASNVALGTALAVNQQFNSEYDERAQALSKLTVSDVQYRDPSIKDIELPCPASRISTIHFNLSALIKHPMLVYQEFDDHYHGSLVSKITELIPGHRALSIRVELPWEATIAPVYDVLRTKAWTELPKLKSLKAYRTVKFEEGSQGRSVPLFEYRPPQNLIMEWTAETGQVDWVHSLEPGVEKLAVQQTNEAILNEQRVSPSDPMVLLPALHVG